MQDETEEIDLVPKGPKNVIKYKDAFFGKGAMMYKGVLINDDQGEIPTVSNEFRQIIDLYLVLIKVVSM